jgi:hypothetical protein
VTTPEEARDIMSPFIDDDPPTEAGALAATYARLPLAAAEVQEVRRLLWKAEEFARAGGRPTDGYRALIRDLDAMVELLNEKLLETVQKMAEAETGTRG